jgi:signal transduction histidine kinase/ActR/RegA family two-component response regulator
MPDSGAVVDPRVLGKILLIQTAAHAIPGAEALADFVCRGLEGLPGASASAVQIGDLVKSSDPALAARVRAGRGRPGSETPDGDGGTDGLFTVPIGTLHRSYGAIALACTDGARLAAYQPFLGSLANTIALTLENRENAASLERLNADLVESKLGLESVVRERTSELVAMNEALALQIEERARYAEQLRESERALLQAQKLEAVGTLASGIAHDFNNILMTILCFADLAQSHLRNDRPATRDLEQISTAARRAADLVKQILTFGRASNEEKHPIRLQPVVEESLRFLRASLPRSIEIVSDIDSHAAMVLADPTQMHQVVMNLCTNAYHAMLDRNEGVLKVSLRAAASAPPPLDASVRPGGWLLLEVSDTGCGMDAPTMERIFDPYFTTKEKGKGTGLGLSVVHGIVQGFGGHIRVMSDLGAGSTFQVYLPALLAESGRDATLPPRALCRGSERIWVLDDERSVAIIEKEILESCGYSVRLFTNAPDLLAAFVAAPGECDLLVSDIGMPHMDGAQLAREILRVRTDLPIILCTGFSETVSRSQALEIGVRDYIMKPLDAERLSTAVRTTLDAAAQSLARG